ncbi:MAG: hypothetical protein NC200_07190 [Candidatus Gastranaerophilales bacterium]|nr:hypothetical protein [Candidatus Gastranaerophilales bacterium]
MEKTKIERITVRLDERLSSLVNQLQQRKIFNLSGLIREAMWEKLSKIKDIDKSGAQEELKKDDVL